VTSYTGKCLVGIKARKLITHVQVSVSGGNSIPLPLSDYVAGGVQPDYATLTWCGDVVVARGDKPAAVQLR
jgi:hypothetical protein